MPSTVLLGDTWRGHVPALLPDNHDIISLKLYQLTVERTPEEEKRDREVYLPIVDNLKLPGSEWEPLALCRGEGGMGRGWARGA